MRGLPALYKGETLLAAFLRESTSLPSPFALGSEASCQQHFGSTLLLPEQEGGRAASPQARSGLAFPRRRGRNPAPRGVAAWGGGAPGASCFQFRAKEVSGAVCFFWEDLLLCLQERA